MRTRIYPQLILRLFMRNYVFIFCFAGAFWTTPIFAPDVEVTTLKNMPVGKFFFGIGKVRSCAEIEELTWGRPLNENVRNGGHALLLETKGFTRRQITAGAAKGNFAGFGIVKIAPGKFAIDPVCSFKSGILNNVFTNSVHELGGDITGVGGRLPDEYIQSMLQEVANSSDQPIELLRPGAENSPYTWNPAKQGDPSKLPSGHYDSAKRLVGEANQRRFGISGIENVDTPDAGQARCGTGVSMSKYFSRLKSVLQPIGNGLQKAAPPAAALDAARQAADAFSDTLESGGTQQTAAVNSAAVGASGVGTSLAGMVSLPLALGSYVLNPIPDGIAARNRANRPGGLKYTIDNGTSFWVDCEGKKYTGRLEPQYATWADWWNGKQDVYKR